jgi:hypothetical protein
VHKPTAWLPLRSGDACRTLAPQLDMLKHRPWEPAVGQGFCWSFSGRVAAALDPKSRPGPHPKVSGCQSTAQLTIFGAEDCPARLPLPPDPATPTLAIAFRFGS